MSCEARVNADILRWARESLAIKTEKAAKAASVTPERYARWEEGKEYPTIAMLRRLANLYKRPLGTFFLPEVPESPPTPTDFRTLSGAEESHLSTASRIAVRRAVWNQNVARDLMVELGQAQAKQASFTMRDSVEDIVGQVRRLPYAVQASWTSSTQALREWRLHLEERGFFVFQYSMPIEEIRGFSLIRESCPPVIVINSKDSVNGRTFTLLHEYGHCLLSKPGICNPEEAEFQDQKASDIERFCNEFAGTFLVPAAEMRRQVREAGELDVLELIHRLSRKFWVSDFVILRRLRALEFIRYGQYQSVYETLLTQVRKPSPSGGDHYKRKFAELGHRFIELVVSAESSGAIPLSEALELLDVKFKAFKEERGSVRFEKQYDRISAMLRA